MSGSIIQGCQEADPWYPFQTAIQSVLKLTGQDVFDQTHRHMINLLAVIHALRNTVRVIARKPLLLKVQNDIPKCHRARFPRTKVALKGFFRVNTSEV